VDVIRGPAVDGTVVMRQSVCISRRKFRAPPALSPFIVIHRQQVATKHFIMSSSISYCSIYSYPQSCRPIYVIQSLAHRF
jgi:hypothetical protein